MFFIIRMYPTHEVPVPTTVSAGGCVKTKRILAPPGQSDERAVPFSRFFDLRMSQGRLMAFERHHGSPDDDEFVNKEPQAPASLIALIRLETPRMRITRLRL